MPEGPSIVIFTEAGAPFAGKRVMEVSGNAARTSSACGGARCAVRSWGKHLLLEFDRFSLRDGAPLRYARQLGRAARRAFWCDVCQRIYGDEGLRP